MKFQNPSFFFFLNERTYKRTDGQAESNILPHLFKVGGIKTGENLGLVLK